MNLERCTKGLCKTCPEERTCNGNLKYYQKIVIDYKLDNWNDTINHCRNNKYSANSKKKKEMDIVRYHLLGIKKIPKYPVRLMCTWHVANMNSDLDNKSLKAVLDQMQLSGILENDNCKHIVEINHKVVKDTKDYLELEIIEV